MPRKPVARDRAEPGSPDSRAMSVCDGDATALGDGVRARARLCDQRASQCSPGRRCSISGRDREPGGGGMGSSGPRRAIESIHRSRSGPGGLERSQRARVASTIARKSSSLSMAPSWPIWLQFDARESAENHEIRAIPVSMPRAATAGRLRLIDRGTRWRGPVDQADN